MSNQAKWLIGAIVIVLVVVIGIGTSIGNNNKITQDSVKIGVSVPLTGGASSLGEFMMGGVELAVDEINNSGGINGKSVELIVEDDECGNAGAEAMNKLVNVNNVDAVVGSICSAAAGPAMPIAQKAEVPVIVWGSAPPLTSVGDFIFRNYPSDSSQGKYASNFITNKLDGSKAAVVYVNNQWGKGLKNVFEKEFPKSGGKIVLSEAVQQGANDLRTVLSKVKSKDVDVLYAPLYPKTGAVLARQLKELSIDLPVVAGDAFANEKTLSLPESEGIAYTQAKTKLPDDFASRAKEVTGREVNVFTPFAYDSVKIFANVMRDVGTNPTAVKEALSNLTYKQSVAVPQVEFDNVGDLKSAKFETIVVKDGESVPYQNSNLTN